MKDAVRNSYDVAIAGAGPAGASLAIRLAMAGFKVLLAEQKSFPRQKLCGEFISPECLEHFRQLGVMPRIDSACGSELNATVFYGRNGKGVAIESEWFSKSGSKALGLSRAHMDARLLERAVDAGVDVQEEVRAAAIVEPSGRVVGLMLSDKNGDDKDYSARIVVDATGRSRGLARRFEKLEAKRAASCVAFKTHLSNVHIEPGVCEIYVYRGGYGGCNEVEEGRHNLCFIAASRDVRRLGGDAETVMRSMVFANTRARAALVDSAIELPWLAVPIERYGRGTVVPCTGLLTVGDAASFIDPFTGSGMLMALQSAQLAATAIAHGFANGKEFDAVETKFRRSYAEAFDARLRICSMLRYAAFAPVAAEAMISLLRLNKGVRRSLARATRF